MRFPLVVKVGALGAVLLVLLIGLQMIHGIVDERQGRQREAEQSVVDGLAGPQAVLGPVLQRDCIESWERVEGEGKSRKLVPEQLASRLTAWPTLLDVKADASIEARHRGIFKLNSFAAKTQVKAEWSTLAALKPRAVAAGHTVRCGAPFVAVAVGDARGIRSAVVRIGDERPPVLPGTGIAAHGRGFHAPLTERAGLYDAPLQIDIDLQLAGTRSLAWIPVADQTRMRLASDWPHPSFGGRFLPATRSVAAAGFDAEWQVSALATTSQQVALELPKGCEGRELSALVEGGHCLDSFGVAFIDPVNGYVLSDRALKYGLLFIGLTFVGVGLMEVLRRLRVHPVQYLLVGSALTLFFLLLLSLSEHMPFASAYAVAASACVALLSFYGCHVLHGLRPGLLFGAAIGLLYGALYALLQMEQTALVLGSLLLFGVLAATMFATRRVDWYGLTAQWRADAQAAQPAAPAAEG